MSEPVERKAVDPKPFVINPAPGVAKVPDPDVQLRRTRFTRTALAILFINTGVIGYYLLNEQRPGQGKDVQKPPSEAPKTAAAKSEPVETATKAAVEPSTKAAAAPPAFVPKAKPPLTQNEQREVYQYVLDEKRKIKPKTKKEKAKLDEEKALLKQWLRSKDIPSL